MIKKLSMLLVAAIATTTFISCQQPSDSSTSTHQGSDDILSLPGNLPSDGAVTLPGDVTDEEQVITLSPQSVNIIGKQQAQLIITKGAKVGPLLEEPIFSNSNAVATSYVVDDFVYVNGKGDEKGETTIAITDGKNISNTVVITLNH